MFNDKTLVCKDCNQDFIFTVGEQEFYDQKGFQNEPARCPQCRSNKKTRFNGDGPSRTREMYEAVCAECGSQTKVPFKPHLEKPVYCSDCFANRK